MGTDPNGQKVREVIAWSEEPIEAQPKRSLMTAQEILAKLKENGKEIILPGAEIEIGAGDRLELYPVYWYEDY